MKATRTSAKAKTKMADCAKKISDKTAPSPHPARGFPRTTPSAAHVSHGTSMKAANSANAPLTYQSV